MRYVGTMSGATRRVLPALFAGALLIAGVAAFAEPAECRDEGRNAVAAVETCAIAGADYPIVRVRATLSGSAASVAALYRDPATCPLVQPGEVRPFGALSVEFFRVCHSIPDACGLAIQTPLGTIVHTGDFKIDHTPVDGRALDLQRIGELGREGVLLLLSDSTAAESPGHTPSEQIVSEGLKHVMADAPGRVLVATFASLIARIQQVVDAAVHDGRKVAFAGRSMMDNVKMALSKGYLQAPSGVIIDIAELELLPPERQVIVITGSQGEPTSVLVRIANRRYREITVGEGDTVILSASTIPGNERVVARTLDDLVRQGARVVTPRTAPVHVGGHGSQEELKLMLRLIEPHYFVPVHGEYRMLAAHAELARAVGVTLENVFVLEDGDVLEISEEEARVVEQVPAGHVYVDGAERFDMSSVILRDRRRLAEEGFAVVVIPFDHSRGQLAGKVEVITHGFVDAARAQELSEQAAHLLANQVFNNDGYPIEWGRHARPSARRLGPCSIVRQGAVRSSFPCRSRSEAATEGEGEGEAQ